MGGLHLDSESYMNYQGIPQEVMHKDFRGECIYQAEQDVHFPQLTVGQTLDFAACARVSLESQSCLDGRALISFRLRGTGQESTEM